MNQAPNAIVALALAGTLTLLANPRLCLFLLFGVSSVFNPAVSLGFIKLYLNNLSLCLFVGSMLIRMVAKRTVTVIASELDRPVGLFACVIVAMYIVSPHNSAALKRLLALGLFFAGYGAARLFCRDKNGLDELVRWVACFGVLAGAYGIYTFHFLPFKGSVFRATGAFGNPNSLANILVMALPLALLVTVNHKSRFPVWLRWFGCGIIVLGLVRTYSRGGFAGTMAIAIFGSVALGHRRTFFIGILLAILTLGHLHLSLLGETQSKIVDLATFLSQSSEVAKRERYHLWVVPGIAVDYDRVSWTDLDTDLDVPESLGARAVMWQQGFEAFYEAPLTGVGLGQADFSAIPYDSRSFDGAFNMFITILAEMGLVGFCAFGYLLITAFLGSSRCLSAPPSQSADIPITSAALLSALLANVIHCLVEDMLYAIMANWFFGFILALIGMLPYAARTTSPVQRVPAPGA